MSPQALLAAVGLAWEGRPEPLAGGDMGGVWRCGPYVVKTRPDPPAGWYPAEARGLAKLQEAGVRVPAVHAVREEGLVLEWLGRGPPDPVGLAEQVARLHAVREPVHGSPDPVFLGRFRLPAGEGADWRAVFVDLRIRPLLARTRAVLGPTARWVERAIDEVRPAVEGPVRVHGDLWSGNVHHGVAGPALIDPAYQVAERGLDLAMMALFGGFSPAFWEAYEAILPIPEPVRRTIPYHQLLYLLVHVHFFGASYVGATERAAREALRGAG